MRRFVLVAAVVVPALATVVSVARGADAPPPPPLEIGDIMLAVNEGADSVVGRLRAQFNDAAIDDDGWKVAKARASLIIEAGNRLATMKPPMGSEDAWKKHAMEYRGCGEAAREAAVKKDAAAGKAAMQSIAKRCNSCHKEHRKEE
jgi:hypothetical protein